MALLAANYPTGGSLRFTVSQNTRQVLPPSDVQSDYPSGVHSDFITQVIFHSDFSLYYPSDVSLDALSLVESTKESATCDFHGRVKDESIVLSS